MKAGDQLPVSISGFDVAAAVIEDISDGKATVYIPATRVQFGVRTELEPVTPEVDRIFGGMVEDQQSNASEASEAHNEAVETPKAPEGTDTPVINTEAQSE